MADHVFHLSQVQYQKHSLRTERFHPFTWSAWNILLTETYFAFFTFPSDINYVTHSV